MTIEEAIYSYLSTHAGLIALTSTRIYPMALPYNPIMPAVTYQRVSTAPLQMFGSTAKTTARFQVTAWATTYLSAREVAAQIVTALDAYSGTMGGVGGVACDWTWMNSVDLIDPETKWTYCPVDFEVWWA